ncbi:MAG: hypothetical protein AAF226_11955, partial [Verrucomicrobiota bacterium]
MPKSFSVPAAMAFRLMAVIAIGWLVHQEVQRSVIDGQRPIQLSEVRTFLPTAHRLTVAQPATLGLSVIDSQRQIIGHVCLIFPQSVSTPPQSDKQENYY